MTGITYRRDFAQTRGLAILEQTEREVVVGAWKPLDAALRRALEAYHGAPVVVVPLSRSGTEAKLALLEGDLSALGPDEDAPREGAGNRGRLRNLPPGEHLLRGILRYAADRGATDLALWRTSPFRWRCTVRVGGRMQEMATLEDRSARVVLRLLKSAAGLDLLQEGEPQNGQVAFPWLPGLTMRVATVGSLNGEALSLRFLGRTPMPLGTLGFSCSELAVVLSALAGSSGLVVCCGPTGSGKTTTVAAMLEILLRNNRKVVTIESPVEYRIPGVLQIPGDDPAHLAAVLRQDPDVICIGETRRRDHAGTLTDAVLTGHLVLTTVHGADPPGALRRLVHLGVPRQVLSSVPVTVIAQQLGGSHQRLQIRILQQGQKEECHEQPLEGV